MIHGALVALVGITHVTARTSLIPVPTFHIGPRLPRWRPRPIPGSLEELAAALVALIGRMLAWLGSGLEDLRYTLFHVPQLVTFRRLAIISIFAADARFHTVGDLVAFLPTGLAHALYAPFPWQWLSAGDAGVFKALSGVETLLTVALTPFVVLGIWRGVRALRFEAATLVITGLILLVALDVTVPNVGTLFRLRLQALVPLLVVASAYGLPAGLRSRWSRGLAHRR